MKGARLLSLAGLLCVVLLVACAALQHRRARLSTALKFSHKRHTAEGTECTDCHEGVDKSGGPTDGKYIPKKSTCASCHEDQVAKQCDYCHVGSDRDIQLSRRSRHLRFSHDAHRSRVKEGCKACHPGASRATRPGVALVQDHDACTKACHKKDVAEQRCTKCHQDLLRQRLKPVAALGHQGDWLKRHGSLARDVGRCISCHDQTHCADCHARTAAMPLSIRFPEKTAASFIHRGDFIGRHAVLARQQPATCRKCHGAKHCQSCHRLQGLVAAAAGSQQPSSGTRNPHGPDWMQPGTAGFHGRRARREISTCASCHDQGAASNCVRCHKVGGLGGNPHPARFKWRNQAGECRTNGMCAACHQGGRGCP